MDKNCVVLSIRDIVVFPHVVVPLFVGRKRSISAIEAAMAADKKVVLVTQRDNKEDDPSSEDMYSVGVLSNILQVLKMPDENLKILVEGIEKVKILKITDTEDSCFSCTYEVIDDEKEMESVQHEAYRRMLVEQFENYAKLNKRVSTDAITAIREMPELHTLLDIISAHLALKIPEKQALLEEASIEKRFELLFAFMEAEMDVIQVERKIRNRVKRQMEKTQKEYYLNEQIKAIQKELGDADEVVDELKALEIKASKLKMHKDAKEKFASELKKLRNMPQLSAEATVVRNYLDWLLNIPWGSKTKVKIDLQHAKEILDRDHYGLYNIKDRILEFLAVQNRVGKLRGSILCFVGPPGVGKTSLARSIAAATGRNYVRVSLGGVRDESEIRGHRRTYIGSMPGKIISSMKKAKSTNPLLLLDEIDKLGADWKGDPSSALLEVLDHEQNCNFNDHYLEIDYDLSDVMFITTANSYKMPAPLLDRLEIIKLSGYTEHEKLEIAKRHLLPKLLKENGLILKEFSITDDAILAIIRDYTREAGVRNLEREISNLCRKIVKEITITNITTVDITIDNLEQYAGIKKFHRTDFSDKALVGVTTGLAWTEVGGELLSIEAITTAGKGKVTLTGKLGDVMQESIQAAMSYVKSRASDFGINIKDFESTDFHIHVPEGATPKDGPSAGVAMITCIVSVLTSRPVRHDVAMTGEITLRGRVLAIGGLKEKILAAHRGGIKTVIIPQANECDLKEISESVLNDLNVIKATTVDDVLENAITDYDTIIPVCPGIAKPADTPMLIC